jgi:hypothetical protein
MKNVLFKSLYGSENYNLNVKKPIHGMNPSDKDYAVVYIPTYKEIYSGKKEKRPNKIDGNDYRYINIINLPKILFKSNLNDLQLLFTKEFIVGDGLEKEQVKLLNKLLMKKEDIARINLTNLLNSSLGVSRSYKKDMYKKKKSNEIVFDSFGYDPKYAMNYARVLDFLFKYQQSGFNNVESILEYNGLERNFMLEIRNGGMSLDSFENYIEFFKEAKVKKVSDDYKKHRPNEKLYKEIEGICYKIVEISVKKELLNN